ncbi:unnamed protein product [Effrenium voratum]|uniref:Uncharacterized protein n=1 Tax=Effrenium voratum TaxID=2562239 RepID=A0AA36HR57_9DINO|nr:unnamed protein product [Effrenium voratum]|mmetsp:Transcript_20215/g.47863  ORF Transcript_20215/g.47863 Transcript_20215/m.47863 type:complete len:110 (-) Transcript_20215:205-534(-)
MVAKFLPFLRRPKVLAKKDRDYQEGCVECEPLPPQLLTDQDVGSQWLPDDLEQRIDFLRALAEHSLPMPQNEAQFHAARVFSDETGQSEYNLDQWKDYLQLHGYSVQSG